MNKLLLSGAAVLALSLAGCGGSSSSDTVTAPVLNIADAQGIWRSASGSSLNMSAVVLPDGKVWALMSNATVTRLLKGSLAYQANSLVGTGKNYTLGTNTIDNLSLIASMTSKSVLSGSIMASGASPESYSLSYQPRYDTAASLADFIGTWVSPSGSSVAVTWTVTAGASSDTIVGTSTTGCTYAGTLSLRSEARAVVDVTVNETCAGAAKQLSGVGLRSDNATAGALVMLTTTASPEEAMAIELVR